MGSSRHTARTAAALLALLTAACTAPGEALVEDPTVSNHDAHACRDAWGPVPDGSSALYVDAAYGGAGAADSDGSVAAPFAAIEEAIEAARGTPHFIGVAPGDYQPPASWRRYFVDGRDWNGLVLAGCGADSTFLNAIVAVAPGGDPAEAELQPVFEVYGEVQGVTLRDFAAVGGKRSVGVRGGAGSETPVRLERLRVLDSLRIAVAVSGLTTQVVLEDVDIVDILDDEGYFGWGLGVQAAGSDWLEPTGRVDMLGGSIEAATGVGVFVDRANVGLTSMVVRDTAPIGGMFGRGVQLQNNATGLLDDVLAEDNTDAAVFLHKPKDVIVRGCVLRGTASGSLPEDPKALTGDGIAVTQGFWSEDPAPWRVVLEANTFEDNARAGAIIEDVTVGVDAENAYGGNGLAAEGKTFPLAPSEDALYFQGVAAVEGVEGGPPGAEGIELGGTSGFLALEILREPLGLDAQGE